MAAEVLDQYLADLAGQLTGPRAARAAVLAEICDGLEEAAARHATRSLSAPDAARAAVAEFGSPSAVAAAFAGELVTAQARRTVTAFILTGPLVGVWWLLLLARPPWPPDPGAILAAVPAVPLAAVATVTGVALLATTGQLIRWLPEATPARAVAGTTAVSVLCLAGDLTVLTVLAVRELASVGSYSATWAAAACTASLVRLACSGRAIRQCLYLQQELRCGSDEGRAQC